MAIRLDGPSGPDWDELQLVLAYSCPAYTVLLEYL